ncbi:MAG: guanylate kinase [Lachnospiraceae bacterium]|nr:guanylate kinase [Lachnospiraceae bacterium]
MGRIYILLGKSATGKDTVAEKVLEDLKDRLFPIVPYTTRPIREGEKQGETYHFVSREEMETLDRQGLIIEKRVYQTVAGPWSYFTVDDGNIDLDHKNYLSIGTLESYVKFRDYFSKDKVLPIYLYIDDGERLERAIRRQRVEQHPNYRELCRRFLADEEDFSEEKLKKAGIEIRIPNDRLEDTVSKVEALIQ